METSNKHNQNEYSYLRRLPSDKLWELLALAPSLSDKPEDEAYVDELEEAIIEREKENPTGFFPDVDQQWEQFVAHYLPETDQAASESEPAEHADFPQTNRHVPRKRVIRLRQAGRTILAAAAAVICALAIMVTAQAAGVDVFGAMARWTEDVFSFGPVAPDSQVSEDPARETAGPETDAPNAGFTSLQEAFDAYGMTEVHEPGWLPEGYAQDGVDVLAVGDPFLRSFEVSYTDGKGRVGINIMSHNGTPATQVQKIGGPVESVEKNGIVFYHVENSVGRTIAWYSDQYEYYLSGDVGDDILWKVVESMFT